MSVPQSLQYQALTVKDVLPQGLAHGAVEMQSTILDRRRLRNTPQNGSSFSGTATSQTVNQLNILLSSGSDYIDLESVTLNATFNWVWADPSGSVASYCLPDDMPLVSMINRLRVMVGGVIVEDIAEAGRKALSEAFASMPLDYYNSVASQTVGAYKFNNQIYGGTVGAYKNQVAARYSQVAGNPASGSAFTGISTTYDLTVPLSLFSGLFRCKRYFPLRNASPIQITIDFNGSIGSATSGIFIVGGGGTPALTSWSLQNVELNYDALSVSPMYATMMDSICAGEAGLSIPFETCQTLQTNYVGSLAPSQRTLAFSKQVKSLSHMLLVRQSASNQNAANWPKLSTFEKCGLTAENAASANFYVQVGGARYPVDAKSAAGCYLLTLDANHLQQSPFGVVMDMENFSAGAQVTNWALDPMAQAQVLGVSFEKIRQEDLFHSGIDTGSQNIMAYLTDNGAGANNQTTAFGFVYFKNILKIQGNMVRVAQEII